MSNNNMIAQEPPKMERSMAANIHNHDNEPYRAPTKFLQVLNLRVFWNKAAGTPFIDTIVPIIEEKPLLEVISEEVLQTNQENYVDFERDIKSAKSLSNKDVSRLLKFPTSVLFKQLANDPLVELTIVIDKRARPDSTTTDPKTMNNRMSSKSSNSSTKTSSKREISPLSSSLSNDSSALSIATEKHRNRKTDRTEEGEVMSHRENDSFTSYAPKDTEKKIFTQDPPKIEGSGSCSQSPSFQPTNSSYMTEIEGNRKTDKTKGEMYHHRTPSLSDATELASMIAPEPPKVEGPNISRVEGQVSTLQEILCECGLVMDEIDNIMDEEHDENEELINKLNACVGTRVADALQRRKLFNHWDYEATRLSTKCRTLMEYKALQEMYDWKRIQWERIACVAQQEKMTVPAETSSLEVESGRRFAYRASLDPSFKASLERASTAAKNMNEQIQAEAKIEIVAIDECLAMSDKEEVVGLNNELVTIKATLNSTYGTMTIGEHVMFELSCRECNKRMSFVGMTFDLKSTMQNHFDQVVQAVHTPDDKIFRVAPDDNNGPKDSWSSKFAQHFANDWLSTHCVFFPSLQNNVSEKGILKFCQENVKVEILRRQDRTKLYWEEWKVDPCEMWEENGKISTAATNNQLHK